MTMLKGLAGTVLVAVAAVSATPAAAVITTFASYNPIGVGANIYWKNSGGSTNGTGGQFYTVATPSSFTPGTALVQFSFNQPALATIFNNIVARFTLLATTPSGNPATGNPDYVQTLTAGTFSFTNNATLTVGSTIYAPGTANLLSATFTTGDIAGRAGRSAGSASGDTVGGTLVYTSDFLDFSGTVNRDFSLALSALSPSFFRTLSPSRALRTFKASSSGNFSSDPAPIVTFIPEPEVWGLMIAGFGLVGVQMRRRSRSGAVAA